jgi:putative DNA primase/helicase
MTEALLEEEIIREPGIADLLGDVRRTDVGNASRLAFLHGDKLRWSPSLGWLRYNGRYWETSDDVMVAGYARDGPRQIIEQAAESDEPGLRSLLCEWALESEKNSSIRAMVNLLKSEPGIRVESDALDRSPWLLNVQNGTLDLKTGKLLSHNPGDLITKMAGASFDPDAQCPRWERFILEVMDGDEDLAGYLRRFSGYALTASTKEQAFLFFSGIGANGKGRFVETLAHILGDYAAPLSPAALTVKYGIRLPMNGRDCEESDMSTAERLSRERCSTRH